MKGNKMYMDIGSILDDVFEAAKDFGERMKNFDPNAQAQDGARYAGPEGPEGRGPMGGPGPMGGHGPMGGCGPMGGHFGAGARGGTWFDSGAGAGTGPDENADFYPNFSYPPMNVYLTAERSLVFEFALSGFEEKNISLSFQGDYMVFSAKIEVEPPQEGARWFKRRLKLKDVDRQKYYVPADKFDQEKVKAVFRNGILRVTVPPRETPEEQGGVKIEIVREGD